MIFLDSCFFSCLMFSESSTNFSVHHQNNALCNIFQRRADGADTGGGGGAKVFQWFKYLIVNDKHHFTTI